MSNYTEAQIKAFEITLAKRLSVFEDYHSGKRKPTTERARHFLEVVNGRELPRTKNEKAYLYHLKKVGRPVVHVGQRLPEHMKSSPYEISKKLDDAAKNMATWKPWHD